MALPGIALSDWVTDDLPDLLWPLVLVATLKERGAHVMSRAQQAVVDAVGRHELAQRGDDFDGRLSSLERMVDGREPIRAAIHSHPLAGELLSPAVVGVLRLYGERLPGRWLFEGTDNSAGRLDDEEALNVLARAIVDVAVDRHLNALLKAAPFGWELMMGRLHLPVGVGDELIDYPMVPDKVDKADAFILSAFLVTKTAIDKELDEARRSWARDFWNSNWGLSECLPEEALDQSQSLTTDDPEVADDSDVPAAGVDGDAIDPTAQADPRAKPIEATHHIYEGFLQSIVDPGAPVDLYSPARFEVLTGFVARAYRSVLAILRAPHQWSGEQAAPVMRALLEARIVATWMLSHDDADWFARYQEYGRGKRKLHREVVRDTAKGMGEEAAPELAALSEELGRRTGGEHWSMFQEVSVDSTFAGKNLRAMADEVGMAEEYRSMFQVESGVTHGEWWAIEEYAMQRCANPLHRFHLLPTFRPAYPPTLAFPQVLLAAFGALVAAAEAGLVGEELPRTDGSDS